MAPIPDFEARVPGECYLTDRVLPYVECPDDAPVEDFIRNIPYALVGIVFMLTVFAPYWVPAAAVVAIALVVWRRRGRKVRR